MNYIYKGIFLFITLLFVTACGDNSYNGKDGLVGSSDNGGTDAVSLSVHNIYKDVILEDTDNTYQNSLTLVRAVEDLNASVNEATLAAAREQFKKLACSYKRMESVYVAGAISDDMRDIADFKIEQFIKHSKNADFEGDLDAVFAGNKALVSNALKSITALEYTLFGKAEDLNVTVSKMNQIRLDSALTMANAISLNLKQVNEFYKSDTYFTEESDRAIGILLNVLVSTSFTLRENRLGDPAGLTAKYLNSPNPERLEYFKSTNSLAAIREILDTHKQVMLSGLKDIAVEGSARAEADAIITILDEALETVDSYTGSLEENLNTSETTALYNDAKNLQNNYTALINALNFTQDIIEADGD